MPRHRVFAASFASIYPHSMNKAERKKSQQGRSGRGQLLALRLGRRRRIHGQAGRRAGQRQENEKSTRWLHRSHLERERGPRLDRVSLRAVTRVGLPENLMGPQGDGQLSWGLEHLVLMARRLRS